MTAMALALLGCGGLALFAFSDRAAVAATPVQFATSGAQCGPDPALDGAPQAPPPPTPASAAHRGVLIVVSIASQRLFVFKDGAEWGSTTVSTGKRGYGTPAGTFTILQKHVKHRSRTYGNAPMPYMQRLTWRGVALHAGRVTGYPASHGCIRLPMDFARQLYALTNPASTSVVILREPLAYAEAAKSAALGLPPPFREPPVRQAYLPPPMDAPKPVHGPAPQPVQGQRQTIQLAATPDVEGADDLWQELSESEPELQALDPVIIPAVVRQMQVYRLRASGPDAFAICSRLTARGIACMKVTA
ncbi:L,D-transpeptidase family protein [Novosphingobium sp. NDB2Meth1]|uniref:L,D-transpeptidase family protein n=1 Tax=Novosphingobium sp. NDB2Meth1 TaxID=1892847 RepID=UPI000ACCD5E6|nr:L,D-transpeptidase family protein [Novosphingobium sp. NDB2Meth1]